MKKIIIILLVVLILITAGAGYWLYRQRMFSKEVLKLEILGNEKITAGEEIEYTLRYKNNGNFTLENVELIFELPENSVSENGRKRITQQIENIYPGQEETIKVKTRLLGKEGDLKVAKAWMSYNPKNLRARYESQTTFTAEINSVPLTLNFDLISRIESGKETNFSLNYFSNMDYSLEDLEIRVEYPEEFEFSESDPEGIEYYAWEIPYLEKTEGGRINIKGIFKAEEGEIEEIKMKLGIWHEGNFIVLKETTKEVEIVKPMIYITQQINGESNYIASPGEKLNFDIYFKNIGNSALENEFLMIRLNGDAFDLSTVKVNLGEIQSGNDLIIWDWRQVSDLRHLAPDDEGKVTFEVSLKDSWDVSEKQIKESVIENSVNISRINKDFQTKVNSLLEISQEVYYQNEAFASDGPIIPQVGTKTTYAVIWELNNRFNDVKNVRIRAVLPQNVQLTGQIFPVEKADRFSFDPVSREVVLAISEFKAGENEIFAFQVGLVPNESQRGTSAEIIKKVTIKGEDTWTESTTINEADKVDTLSIKDLLEEQGIVQ